MKKAIVILLSSALLVAAFSGCAIRNPGDSPVQPSTTAPPASTAVQTPGTTGNQGQETDAVKPTEPTIPKRLSQEEELAIKFVTALVQKDYDAVLPLLSSSVYSDSPVFADDIEWALPRTDFRVLNDLDAQTAEYYTVLDHSGNVLVTVRDASGMEETPKYWRPTSRSWRRTPVRRSPAPAETMVFWMVRTQMTPLPTSDPNRPLVWKCKPMTETGSIPLSLYRSRDAPIRALCFFLCPTTPNT